MRCFSRPLPGVSCAQMHKEVPPRPAWRSVIVRHQHFKQRLYYLPSRCARGPARGDAGWGLPALPRAAWRACSWWAAAFSLWRKSASHQARAAVLCCSGGGQHLHYRGGYANGSLRGSGLERRPSKQPAKKRPRKR